MQCAIFKKKAFHGLKTTGLLVFHPVYQISLKESLCGISKLILDQFLSGYRKGFSTQQALLSSIERWKNTLDQNKYGGVILMDL